MSLPGRYVAKYKDRSRVFEVGARTALVSLCATLLRSDNDAKDPMSREVSPAMIDDLEIDVLKVSVFDDDKMLGEYAGSEIPEAEVRFWTQHVEVWLKRRLSQDPDWFDWFLVESPEREFECD